MPIYEYRCDCGGTFEVLAAYGAPAPICPACGAETRKLVSGFALGGRADAGLSQSRMPQTWKGTYAATPNMSPVSSDSGSNADVSRSATPSWQTIAARSWPMRVLTRPSRCAPATPRPRHRRVARRPWPDASGTERRRALTPTPHPLTGTLGHRPDGQGTDAQPFGKRS